MVQITIDTQKDSPDMIRKIIEILQESIRSTPVRSQPNNNVFNSLPTSEPVPSSSGGFSDMFGSSAPTSSAQPMDMFGSSNVQKNSSDTQKTGFFDMFAPSEPNSTQASPPKDVFSTFSHELPSSTPNSYPSADELIKESSPAPQDSFIHGLPEEPVKKESSFFKVMEYD